MENFKFFDFRTPLTNCLKRSLVLAAVVGYLSTTMPPAFAVPTETTGSGLTTAQSDAPRGREILRAQLNALQPGLENLRRLRGFFDENTADEQSVLYRAQRLVETLPPQDGAGEAAWRIAAVASLTLRSGTLAEVDVDSGYRLQRGSLGWDFGPDGSDVQTGFTPVTPAMLVGGGGMKPVGGTSPLTDGIGALRSFEATLPNGLYRIVIMRDGADGPTEADENPFGGDITVNGSPVRSRTDAPRERLNLTGEDAPGETGNGDSKPTPGLAVEGWAIVEDGRLRVDFAALPDGRAITAIIAEPFEIDRIDLEPAVAETLTAALDSFTPASGPEPRIRANGAGPGIGRTQPTGFQPAPSKRSASGNKAPAPRIADPSPTNFAANRNISRRSAPGVAVTPDPIGPTFGTNDATGLALPFEEREILVKRSQTAGADSDGMAIDLGALLDEASLSGTFGCATEPCATLPPTASEPDLDAVATLLGSWLDDPETLPDSWDDLQIVLDGREAGDEIAVVYPFDVDPEGWTDVELRLSAGTGLFAWLDGAYIFGAVEDGPFVDDLDFEYSIMLPDLDGGRHFLQLLSESSAGTPGYALELRGAPRGETQLATSVSEPGTLAMLGIGLLAVGIVRRRSTCR